jgi:hypothetical protein
VLAAHAKSDAECAPPPDTAQFQKVVTEAHAKFKDVKEGKAKLGWHELQPREMKLVPPRFTGLAALATYALARIDADCECATRGSTAASRTSVNRARAYAAIAISTSRTAMSRNFPVVMRLTAISASQAIAT